MKNITVILLAIVMAGCANMSERERQTAWIVGGIVVGAAIISSQSDSNPPPACTKKIVVRPNGSDQICN